jgi:DNA (cytosine-5)-methyltransferase 1
MAGPNSAAVPTSGAVPQRRRRVFVVGCLGNANAAAQVLFERESVQRDSSSRRTTGQNASADAEGCAGTVSSKWAKGTGGPAGDECYNLTTQPIGYRWQNNRDGLQQDDAVAAMRASTGGSGFHEMNHPVVVQPVPFTKAKRAQSVTDDETWVDGQVNPTLSLFDQGDTRATTVAVAFHPLQDPISSTDGSTHCMGTRGSQGHASIAVACCVAPTITAGNDPSRSPQSSEVTQQVAAVHAASMTVRRLTPIECEFLQGFPRNYTLIPWRKKQAEDCPDGPRYKALGNSMAVNCMSWIGERIAALENNR